MPNVAREREGDFHVYDYICEGCESEGELKVPVDRTKPFGCPEGCGATYVQWDNPISERTELMCVVCPVFEDDDSDEDVPDEDPGFDPEFLFS